MLSDCVNGPTAACTRPLRGDSGLIRAVGVVLSIGGKIATAEAMLFTADNTLVAPGTSTMMILNDTKWSTGILDEPRLNAHRFRTIEH